MRALIFGNPEIDVALGPISGAVFTYRYNSAGQLAQETSTVHAGQAVGKNVSYGYYANCYIQSLTDTRPLHNFPDAQP